MEWSKTIDLAPYAPDLSPLGTGVTPTMTNVIPRGDGYGPFKSLTDFTQALPAACRGYFFARRSDGSIAVFAGTSTRLYILDNTNFSWTDASKGGAAYGDLVAADNWQFAQFNEFVIAVQVNTAPQKYTLNVGGAFADLAGSPPAAGSISIVNRIVVLSSLLTTPRRVQWSDLDAPEQWTAGVGISDFQDLPDGGVVNSTSGGDAFGMVFQDDIVRDLIYAPGSSTTFQIRKLAEQETLFGKYSIVSAVGRTAYLSAQGFKMRTGSGIPEAIGKEWVDQFFFADVDRGNLQLVIGGTDPTHTRFYWAYKSGQGLAGLFDKILTYDWSMPPGKQWTILNVVGEYIASLAKPGLTLEQLDAIAPTPLTVTGAANNGAGLIRLTLNAVSNANFAIAGQNFIEVQGVTGTVEANGSWAVNIIDATHIDLIGSAFVNAYTGGGAIGGSLDALPFSLDSVAKSSVAALSAFSSSHKCGFFDGANLEAIMETAEQDGKGEYFWVSGLRPLTDSPDVLCSIGKRKAAKDATVTYTTETAINDQGFCGQLVESRYVRGRMRIPAGKVWKSAQGMQALMEMAGDS